MASHRRTSWHWIAGLLSVAASVGSLAGLAIRADRRTVLHSMEERTSSMTRLLIAHAEAALEDANKVIVAVEPTVRAWDRGEPVQGTLIFNRLRELIPGSPQIASAWIMDGKGLNKLDSWSNNPEGGAEFLVQLPLSTLV